MDLMDNIIFVQMLKMSFIETQLLIEVFMYIPTQNIFIPIHYRLIFSIDTTIRILFVVFFRICKIRLSLSSNHTVQTSFLLCIGKKIKILKMNAYFNSTEWLPRNLYSRKQCTLNLVAIEAQPGMLFNAGFGVFHGLQFS